MTFEQIEKEGMTYVNKYGVVFTPFQGLSKIMVTYSIDSDTSLGLIEPVPSLTALFRNPGKVDYLTLTNWHQLQITP